MTDQPPKRKKLEDIRPANVGVKVKPRRSRRKEPPKQKHPPIIRRNAAPPETPTPPPSDEALKTAVRSNKAQERLMEAIKEINRLMNVTVLPENKSVAEKDRDRAAVASLVSAVQDVEAISPGEGILAMAILTVRQGMSLRDAGNRLAYMGQQMEDRLSAVEAVVAEDSDGEK